MILQETEANIELIISNMMDKILDKRINKEPFDPTELEAKNPFGFNLVPMEIWKSSKFERSFVTSLGQMGFEQIAKEIAIGTGAYAETQHTEPIVINTYRKEKIDEILNGHRRTQRLPHWETEIKEILSLNNNRFENLEVLFDLYIRRSNGKEEYYSIKTVKPNLDQTEIAKRDMLSMISVKDCEVYFALPYNPAGEGNNYRSIHSIPYKIFNMDIDPCILIGSNFWNKIGQDPNTYRELLNIFHRVGQRYTPIIKSDYLGL